MTSFASDNYAGALPEVLQAVQAANAGHAPSYGADPISKRATDRFREAFGAPADVFYVFNGTGANVLAAAAAAASHRSVLVADTSHFYNDESTAPETVTGCRFFPLPADDAGKLTPDIVARRLVRKGDVHYAQPAVLSVTQSTEYGTVYTPGELQALGALCKAHGLYFHLDGARLANAAASLGCSLAAITRDAGVDILSFGGTKMGLLFGEAVVVFHPDLADAVRFKQKQVMQLPSKARFIAAQFEAVLQDEAWRRHAAHANRMAALLRRGLEPLPGVRFTKPTDANALFAILPPDWVAPLQAVAPFYVWNEATGEVRLMTAWDTTEADVQRFIAAAQALQAR